MESPFFYYQKANRGSPTDFEKKWFFSHFGLKKYFFDILGGDKHICVDEPYKFFEHFRWKFRGFLTSDGKGGKKVKKLAQNPNNFHTHF